MGEKEREKKQIDQFYYEFHSIPHQSIIFFIGLLNISKNTWHVHEHSSFWQYSSKFAAELRAIKMPKKIVFTRLLM